MALKGPVLQQLPDDGLMGLDAARSRLALVWLTGASLVLLILVLQSLFGKYGDKVQEAWGWLLPTLMPTLGMIIAVLGYSALDPNLSAAVVRRAFFQVAFWLSSFYLLLISLTLLLQPFVGADVDKAIGMMRMSNLWLGPIQGLVASALGVLFVSKRKPGD
jgi:hypothetical protein